MSLIKGITNGKAKDKILALCVENVKGKNYSISGVILKERLFPDSPLESIRALIVEIESHSKPIAMMRVNKKTGEHYIMPTNLTEQFLERGGFTAIEAIKATREEGRKKVIRRSSIIAAAILIIVTLCVVLWVNNKG